MDKIAQLANSLKDELILHRRELHSYPESGWNTFVTTAKIAKELKSYGYDLKFAKDIIDENFMLGIGSKENLQKSYDKAKELLGESEFLELLKGGFTGVVAEIDTKRKGDLTAFRFDIDGVDLTEEKNDKHRPFKDGFCSRNDGVTHACGHDGHTSIGLGLAKLISQNLDKFNGKFRFIFQTGEEGCRGAVPMEKAGVVKDANNLFGAHLGIGVKSRAFACGAMKIYSTFKFDVKLTGKSAHASGEPENGANALLAAAQIALNMHAITRNSKGVTRVNVGILRAGEGRNVIAPNGFLACEIRGQTTELNEFMKQKCFDIIEGVCKIYSVDYEIIQTGGADGGSSSKEAIDIFYQAAKASPFIDTDKITKEIEFVGCDDYSHFMNSVQKHGGISAYGIIGSDLTAGHHNGYFDFDEDSLVSGVDVFLRVAYELNGIKK